MIKKIHILLVIFMLGFFGTPRLYACGKNSAKAEKSSCSSKKASKSTEKDCCEKDSSNKNDKGCSGKCGHDSCHCSTSCYSFIPMFIVLNGSNNFFTDSSRKKIHHKESLLSPGFVSIWTPPNIG